MSPRACIFAVLALAAPVQAHAASATAPMAVKMRILPTCIAKTASQDRVSIDCARAADERSRQTGRPNADSEATHVVRTYRDKNGGDGAQVVSIEF